MSSTFRYVKEFEFPSAKNYCYGGKAMKKATGGDVTVNEKGERLYVSRPASQTTAVSTTATKTLSKKEQRQALKAQEKSAKEAQRMANRYGSSAAKPSTTSSATTTTTAAKARGGVMKKAEGGTASFARQKANAVKDAAHQKANAARDAFTAKQKAAETAAESKSDDNFRTASLGTMRAGYTAKKTAAKARGGVMKKADGGEVAATARSVTPPPPGSFKALGLQRQRPASASTPLPTRQYSSTTRQYTPAENQQRAVARREANVAKDAVRQKAHDARVAAAKKLEAVKEADNAARKGMNVPGTEANKLKLAGKLSDKKGTGSVTRPATSTGTTASAAMAKAHGGVAHKAMTKKSRGGVPAHSNTPMIKKASGGYVASPPQREGMSYNPGPMPAKKSRR